MYTEGNIIYFDPFYFKNGRPAKRKYLLVVKVMDGKTILASLPSSVDYIPAKDVVVSGCVELPESNLNCYVIAPKTPVTKCEKVFDLPTYLYGHLLDTYELETMNDVYQVEGVDYEIFGEMRKDVFEDFIKCLKSSNTVKRKYLKLL